MVTRDLGFPGSLPSVDPRMLQRANQPGRVRGIGLELFHAARQHPERASGILRQGLRDARALHSRERRFVGDAIHGLIRHQGVLERWMGKNPEQWWEGWVQLLAGELDGLQRVYDELPSALDHRLALLASCDLQVAADLLDSLGDSWPQWLEAVNGRSTPHIRVAKGSRASMQSSLKQRNIETTPDPFIPFGLRVVGRANLLGHPAYRSGGFELQDLGSQALAALVAPEAGDVLDACAGAGGKSLALQQRWQHGQVYASDVRGSALAELCKRAKRAGLHIPTVRLDPDGPLPSELLSRTFHRVLVDAPCSSIGVWRRHPEYRWRTTGQSLSDLNTLQASILDRMANTVAPGGRLIYGTCSILHRENRDIVQRFLDSRNDFTLLPASQVLQHPAADQMLQCRVDLHDTDGLFGAVLVRSH